ncbi:MAG: nucleoside triphosphate pyrophosphohydrolase family protein [Patescibacteria group bacterium]
MTFEEYQKLSRKTAAYPKIGENFVYPLLGLAGESGEVAEKLKKVFRDKGGVVTEETKKEITKELGDVLWYLSQLATELEIPFEEVAKTNLEKLFSRLERNVIRGDGDNR